MSGFVLSLLVAAAATAARSPQPLAEEPTTLGFEVGADGDLTPTFDPVLTTAGRAFGPLDLSHQHLRQARSTAFALPELDAFNAVLQPATPDPALATTPDPAAGATTPDPAAGTAAPTAAPTTPAAPPPTTAPTVPPTTAPTALPGNAIVIAPVDSTPPPPDNAEFRAAEYQREFEENDPLLEPTIWTRIGIPILVAGGIVVVLTTATLLISQNSDDVEENELELPENMYGETFATVVMVSYKFQRDGGKTVPAMCELFSSIVLLGVTYSLIWIMIGVAENTIASVDQDVEERDSLFEKFRDPVIWQAQNWELYPDSDWRRESMVWFCHDIIYGKAKHVNELGPIWYTFSWVVLVIWFSYMLFELRECFKLKLLIWNTPTVPAPDMVTPNKEEGKIVVNGLSYSVKGVLTILVLLPKLALNLAVAYIGCVFLLYNDLDDDLQEVLLKTIEMAFILEMDELVYEAFAATPKKQQLSQIEMPTVIERGVWRVMSRYGEFPRFMICIGLASYLCITVNTEQHKRDTLTPKQAGVIEGCCNFMQYLKGAGKKVALADGNPCTSFRETYEAPMGLDDTGGVLPPGDVPLPGAPTAGGVAGALLQTGAQLAVNAVHRRANRTISSWSPW